MLKKCEQSAIAQYPAGRLAAFLVVLMSTFALVAPVSAAPDSPGSGPLEETTNEAVEPQSDWCVNQAQWSFNKGQYYCDVLNAGQWRSTSLRNNIRSGASSTMSASGSDTTYRITAQLRNSSNGIIEQGSSNGGGISITNVTSVYSRAFCGNTGTKQNLLYCYARNSN